MKKLTYININNEINDICSKGYLVFLDLTNINIGKLSSVQLDSFVKRWISLCYANLDDQGKPSPILYNLAFMVSKNYCSLVEIEFLDKAWSVHRIFFLALLDPVEPGSWQLCPCLGLSAIASYKLGQPQSIIFIGSVYAAISWRHHLYKLHYTTHDISMWISIILTLSPPPIIFVVLLS